jgi:Fur family ferric uptake transcriptional regulator
VGTDLEDSQHGAAAASVADHDAWRAELHARSLRATPARLLVLRTLQHLGHATVEQIHHEVGALLPGTSPSTIYRTLESLCQQGVLTHIHLAEGATAYQLHDHGEHGHLVCRRCSAVLELDGDAAQALVRSLERHHGFNVELSHLSLFGVCRDCADS